MEPDLDLTPEEIADIRIRAADVERLTEAASQAQRTALYAQEGWTAAVRAAIVSRGLPSDHLFRVDYDAGRLVDTGPAAPPDGQLTLEAAAI